MPSPTTEEYLHASQSIYYPDHPETATRAGLKPFIGRSGEPMTVSNGGTLGAAYLDRDNNVVIAYQGTNSSRPLSALTREEIRADEQILDGAQPPEFREAQRFAARVVREAGRQGIETSRIFVTGHSLGGAEAEYVAQQAHLAGESFGAPGLPTYRGGDKKAGAPPFTNHVAHGDPVGNFASDTLERPIAGEAAHHYGAVHMVGPPVNGAGLARDVDIAKDAAQAMTHPSPDGNEAAAITMTTAEFHAVSANLRNHALNTSYAPALGITPLPEPQAERRQASLSPQDFWRQVAAHAVLAQAAGTRLAADTGPSADGHAPARSARPDDVEASRDPWHAVAARAPLVGPQPAADTVQATIGAQGRDQPVQPRPAGMRLG